MRVVRGKKRYRCSDRKGGNKVDSHNSSAILLVHCIEKPGVSLFQRHGRCFNLCAQFNLEPMRTIFREKGLKKKRERS